MRSQNSLKCRPHRHLGVVALHNRALRIIGHTRQNLQEESAGRGSFRPCQKLAGSDEPNAVAGQCGQLLIQVKDASAEPINFVDDNAIELPFGGVGHQPNQRRAAGFGPAEPGIHVFPGNLPVTPGNVLTQFPQFADSEGWRSAFRGDVDQRSELMSITIPK